MFPLRIAALRFAPEGRVVLDELDLVLAGEGISVILGPNGSGKTVLLRLLAGLLPVHGGTIVWGDAAQPAGRLAMVFQQPMLPRQPRLWLCLKLYSQQAYRSDISDSLR